MKHSILHQETGFICEYVDMNHHPLPRMNQSNAYAEITIGDLHGSAIKLLFFLLREGVLAINTDESVYEDSIRNQIESKTVDEIYQLLLIIYQKEADQSHHPINLNQSVPNTLKQAFNTCIESLEASDLAFFKAVIARSIINNQYKIRLMGDVFADRGMNDYFTLLIIQRLHQADVHLEFLASNHDGELWRVMQSGLHQCIPPDKQIGFTLPPYLNTRFFYPTLICARDQMQSVQNMGALIYRGLISAEEVQQIIDECYLPYLKLLAYSQYQPRTGIQLYVHGIVGFETIKGLAVGLGVSYQDETRDDLCQTITLINERFQQLLKMPIKIDKFIELGEWLTEAQQDAIDLTTAAKAVDLDAQQIAQLKALQESSDIHFSQFAYYFQRLVWSRDHYHRQTTNEKTYAVTIVNGHDSGEDPVSVTNTINLDNQLAKNISLWSAQWCMDHQHEFMFVPFSPSRWLDDMQASNRGEYTIIRLPIEN